MTLEVCVDTAEGLAEAVAGGADRIELCSALGLGGLTPTAGLIAEAARVPVPVMAMIRPRAGDFVWSEADLRMMEAEIAAVRAAGLSGVVLGASLPDLRLDALGLKRLVAAAAGLDLTLHRCFDLVPDPAEALETAIALGFRRVLTSGGEKTVAEGLDRLTALVAQGAGRISVMPGSGVAPALAPKLKALGVAEVHASCGVAVEVAPQIVTLGFSGATQRRTSVDQVRALKAALG